MSDIFTHGNKWQVSVLHLYLPTPILVTAEQLFRKPAFFPETRHSQLPSSFAVVTVLYSEVQLGRLG